MTAEIVAMNREAVALASDSAVTTVIGGSQKIFTSAVKIFSLSDSHPVGVMFFNNAYIVGVPWETIIRNFRSHLPKQGYDTLEQYVDDFVSFLGSGGIFTSSDQEVFVYSFIRGYLEEIEAEIEDELKKGIVKDEHIDDAAVKLVVANTIAKHHQHWKDFRPDGTSSISMATSRSIIRKYAKIVEDAKGAVFGQLPISSQSLTKLNTVFCNLLVKGSNIETNTGIVIAGFGVKELFPSVRLLVIDGVLNNKLKYIDEMHRRIGIDTDASLHAFAQNEMVRRFMEGVDPLYQEAERGFMSELPNRYAEEVVRHLSKYNNAEREKLKAQIIDSCRTIVDHYKQEMDQLIENQFTAPITDVLASLPKSELANLAESLVSLTSVKRRFSRESETVAEPIDVAVMSKADGFIWIKRKQYFEPELNPHYFTRAIGSET